jgi:hypothetical protein
MRERVRRPGQPASDERPTVLRKAAGARRPTPIDLQRDREVLELQHSAGNQAVTGLIQGAHQVPVQRALNVEQVKATQQALEIKGEIQAVEAPRKAKALDPMGSYPASSQMNVKEAIKKKSMASLNFPDMDEKTLKESWAETSAVDIVDGMLGGGAYNHGEDLVVLSEGYKPDALQHEMGHKKQNEQGFNAASVAVVLLEYHNVLANQNKPWLEKGTGSPRLDYDSDAARTKTKKTWADLQEHVKGTLHHTPQAVAMLGQIEALIENEKYKPHAAKIKANLVAEYFAKVT